MRVISKAAKDAPQGYKEEWMSCDKNVVGQIVCKLRYERGWSQDQLVSEMHSIGISGITRSILANIELLRSRVSDRQIQYLAEAFGVKEQSLFPKKRHLTGNESRKERGPQKHRRRNLVNPTCLNQP